MHEQEDLIGYEMADREVATLGQREILDVKPAVMGRIAVSGLVRRLNEPWGYRWILLGIYTSIHVNLQTGVPKSLASQFTINLSALQHHRKDGLLQVSSPGCRQRPRPAFQPE